MLTMKPVGAAFGASFEGRVYQVTANCVLTFAVNGLTGGEVTIEYSTDYNPANSGDATWFPLDETNLVFAADAAKWAIWGGTAIRAVGSAGVTGDDLFVGVSGRYIHDLSNGAA
jgi:hypothetical protein